MDTKMTLREFQKKYRNGAFQSPSVDEQITTGWTDWFCEESELADRLKTLWDNILQHITNDFLLDNFAVSFRNCCPVDFPLYDEISFRAIDETKSEKLDIIVAVNSPNSGAPYAVYTARNYNENEQEFDTTEDLIDFLHNWETESANTEFYKWRKEQDDQLMKLIAEGMAVLREGEALLAEMRADDNKNNT